MTDAQMGLRPSSEADIKKLWTARSHMSTAPVVNICAILRVLVTGTVPG